MSDNDLEKLLMVKAETEATLIDTAGELARIATERAGPHQAINALRVAEILVSGQNEAIQRACEQAHWDRIRKQPDVSGPVPA